MCRNIRNLHNFAPPASQEEVRDAALQYVRKISGFTKPSRANEAAFERAVDAVAHATMHLLDDLVTNAPPKDLGQAAVEPLAKLVGVILALGAAPAGDDHTGGGHSGQPGKTDELPGRSHRAVSYRP